MSRIAERVSGDVAIAAITSLLRAADRAGRSLEDFFRGHQITSQQYNVLRVLRGAGDPLPTMDIADRLIQQTPGLTGILDRLERKRLVRRDRSDADRRVWLCSLTVAGRQLLSRIDEEITVANLRALEAARDQIETMTQAWAQMRTLT